MSAAHVRGVGLTPFGRHDGSTALGLMAQAAQAALDDAGLERCDIDGLLCGYATTLPHLMLSTLFAEAFALRPAYAHSLQLGGATGCAMAIRIRARPVDVDVVMGMLDGRHPPAAAHELGHQTLRQRRLAGVLPAGDPEDARRAHAMIRSAWA